MENTATSDGVLGVILAGGLSRRMGGGHKGLLELAGRPVLRHVIDRLMPQVDQLVLNANGDMERWRAFGLTVVPDALPDHPGPLAGLLSAMDWAAVHCSACSWIVAAPCDSPFLPRNFVQHMKGALDGARATVASSSGRRHPVAGLFHLDLRDDLASYLAGGGRRAGEWAARVGARTADFAAAPVDPFFNINTPEELAEAERLGVH